MSILLELPAATVEMVETSVTADVDPTGFTVSFAFTERDGTHSWTAGTWVGAATVNSAGDYVTVARTPSVGVASADVTLDADTRYGIYCKVEASGETPVIGPQRLGYLRLVST